MNLKSALVRSYHQLKEKLGLAIQPNPSATQREKTLYLHFGTHKTGTSSLQVFLSKNRKLLAGNGLVYPKAGCSPEGAHHYFVNALIAPDDLQYKPDLSLTQYLDRIRSEFDRAPAVLLSSEIFMRGLPSFISGTKPDPAYFEPLFSIADKVKPIIYFRHQEDYLESFYRQSALERMPLTPEQFVNQRGLDYLAACEDLSEIFGKENLIVRPYEKSRFSGGSLFADFLSIFDISLTSRFASTELRANPSLVADVIEFRRLINCLDVNLQEARKFNKAMRTYSARCQSSEQSSGFDKLFFDLPLRHRIREASAPINAQIAEEYVRESNPFLTDSTVKPDIDESSIYRGLDQAGLVSILDFLKSSEPQLIEFLKEIVQRPLPDRSGAGKAQEILSSGIQ